jgi:hypothetical protein
MLGIITVLPPRNETAEIAGTETCLIGPQRWLFAQEQIDTTATPRSACYSGKATPPAGKSCELLCVLGVEAAAFSPGSRVTGGAS